MVTANRAMLIKNNPARGLLRKIAERAGIDIRETEIADPTTLLDAMGRTMERQEGEQKLTRVKKRRK